MVQIFFHEGDLPDSVKFTDSVAVDTETMGLNLNRDRLCLVQLGDDKGNCHIVHFKKDNYDAPHLKALFLDSSLVKIFQYARFDLAAISSYIGVMPVSIYCTKVASKIARTNASSHSLKALCAALLNVDLVKEEQTSDWGAEELTKAQLQYAANDVLYLHQIKDKLDALLKREGRFEYAKACIDFLPHAAALDLAGWNCENVFAH